MESGNGGDRDGSRLASLVTGEHRELGSFINPASTLGLAALLLGVGLPGAGLVSPMAGLVMVIVAVALIGVGIRLALHQSEPRREHEPGALTLQDSPMRQPLPPDPYVVALQRGQAPYTTPLATAALPGDTHLYRPDPAEIERFREASKEIQLRKDLEILVDDLRQFLLERREVLDTSVPTRQDTPDPDQEVDPKTLDELVDEMAADAGYAAATFQMRYRLNGETVEQYHERFDGRVFDVLDRLRKARCIDQQQASHFTYVEGSREVGRIGELARFLAGWERRLRRGR